MVCNSILGKEFCGKIKKEEQKARQKAMQILQELSL